MADPKSPAAKEVIEAHRHGQRRRRISIALTLILSFGPLIATAILVVLGLAVWTAAQNTVDLLRDRADLGARRVTELVQAKLSPAEEKAAYLAQAIARGALDPADRAAFAQTLFGVLASGPAVGGVIFIGPDFRAVGVRRRGARGVGAYDADLSKDADVRKAMAWARTSRTPMWGEPNWRAGVRFTILSLLQPVWKDGRFLGLLVVAVRIDDISRYLPDSGDGRGAVVFIVYGRTAVLAHRLMANGYAGLSAKSPLPPLGTFRDPVLAHMWTPAAMRKAAVGVRPPLLNHIVQVDGVDHIFVYRRLTDYTATPWYVGAYFRGDVIGREIGRLIFAAVAGLVALLVAVLVAFLIGVRLSRPIGRLSSSARLVSEMRLDDVGVLPASRVRELDDQNVTFNSMVGALRWFEAYVPKPVVRALMREGDLAALQSDKRGLTVMFTDIASYSTISEDKSAAEIAALLNQHFTILSHAIEAEGGTVDKFIGDSVMAFWGAPEKQKNRAIRACRAALAIRGAIHADNRARAARGEPPVRVRIGIHSGEGTVGNIGPPDRVNYTVIGDDVNVAQRLEQLGKEVSPDAEVAITISAATVADLEDQFEVEPVGEMEVKGREQPVLVYRLLDGPATP